jgi:hypothetical protein
MAAGCALFRVDASYFDGCGTSADDSQNSLFII